LLARVRHWDSIARIMFELWKLESKLRKFERISQKRKKAFTDWLNRDTRVDDTGPVFEELPYDEVEDQIETLASNRLWRQARALDVEMPAFTDKEMWVNKTMRFYLTPKGRTYVRKLIDAEKTRRFEVKTLWVTKLILPILAGLVGIIGALTGLFAILHRKP